VPPGISPQAVQRIFPFIEKLGNWTRGMQMDRNFAHAVDLNPRVALPALSELVEATAPKVRPWDAFKQSVLHEPFKSAAVEAEPSILENRLQIGYGGEGSPSKVHMFIEHSPRFPENAKLGLMESEASGRGGAFMGPREGRGRPKDIPPVAMSMADRKRFFDELLTRADKSGLKTLRYEAEPGSRPALYEKMTGKRQEQTTRDTGGIMEKFKMDTGPQKDLPLKDARVEPVPTYGPARVQWARRLSLGTPLKDEGVEMALHMDAEEAVGHGLATRVGNLFKLTHSGIEEVRKALREMGGL
jgi:hypothetical protein